MKTLSIITLLTISLFSIYAHADYRLYQEHMQKVSYAYPVDSRLKIDHKRLGACMALRASELFEDALYISKNEMNLGYQHLPFFLYLSANKNRHRYETGTEQELRLWII